MDFLIKKTISILIVTLFFSATVAAQGQRQGKAQFQNLELSTIIKDGQLTHNLHNNTKQKLEVHYEIWDVQQWIKRKGGQRHKHVYALFQINSSPKPKPNARLFKGAIHQDNLWWRIKPLGKNEVGPIHQDNLWWRILSDDMDDETPLHTGIINLPSATTVPIHLQESLEKQATYLLVLRVQQK